MIIDTEFTITIKMSDMYLNDNLSEEERIESITKEGEKRLRYYLSGYLLDPDKKIIHKNVIINNLNK